ncbi:MAG: aminoacyl-tRNA hydrolase [Candidatus Phytoplasma pyri]|uniref:aminoacyl-tRNA hydrolase n=1 Tax=Candidatus Phytoplasma pyri TaxID=47566 RepID=UPI003983C61D
MKLIVGLGNPGENYRLTLHNIGFMMIDYLLNTIITDKKILKKHNSYIYESNIEKKLVLLVKPQTYMNSSGYAVKKILNEYKILLDDFLVLSDDIYLPEGKFKLKLQGGHGGHNGIRNIIDCLQTKKFKRLKIGVNKNHNTSLEDYLLTPIDDKKKLMVQKSFPIITNIIKDFIENSKKIT